MLVYQNIIHLFVCKVDMGHMDLANPEAIWLDRRKATNVESISGAKGEALLGLGWVNSLESKGTPPTYPSKWGRVEGLLWNMAVKIPWIGPYFLGEVGGGTFRWEW